ncbi:hypothetical protein [Streptomyces sp. SAS_272]|uniref:hypothetical protein n=1 Tax=Streptomyces sp. SAS_272 TaxID=3412747 RepID=UPI00403C58C4
MPVTSETEPHRAGLPAIELAVARVSFRAAETSGLGAPGTDDHFDEWLDRGFDIAFYRTADRPLQARAVEQRDHVPEWLSNSRIGKASLVAVCLNPYRDAPSPSEEPDPVSSEAEEDTEAAEGADTCTCAHGGMPGLCWGYEAGKRQYAKVENQDDHEDHENDEDEVNGDCVLELVDDFAEGVADDPIYDLSDELPADFNRRSFQALTTLTDVAQARLDRERRTTDGPWRLWWSSCGTDVTDPLNATDDTDSSGADSDEESDDGCYYVSLQNDDDHTVEVIRVRGADQRVMYSAPVWGSGSGPQARDTLEALRSLLQRVTEQVRQAGYMVEGDWTVNWSRCYVLLANWDH